jgi:hypothetical protein
MASASGALKQVRFKAEGTFNTAPGATGAQLLRRVSSTLALRKAVFESAEIRRDLQRADMRHGVHSVGGAINGELSAGTWQSFFAAAVRQAFQSAPTTGAIITVTAQATAPQFARSSGSFLTDGFKLYDVVRWTGFAGGSATDNNSRNFLITALTATDMTGVFLDGTAVAADAAGDSVTCTLVGKKTWVPLTGHTDVSYGIEHWHPDINQGELFLGCKINQMDIAIPPQGLATIGMDIMGASMTEATAEYFTTPTAETQTGGLAGINGALYLQGSAVARVTGLSFGLRENMSAEPELGATVYSDIDPGRILVDGQLTAKFVDATVRDYFVDETEVALAAILTASGAATADLLAFVMSRIKMGGADKDDGEKSLIQTLPFTALLDVNGGAAEDTEETTFSIQDSQAS